MLQRRASAPRALPLNHSTGEQDIGAELITRMREVNEMARLRHQRELADFAREERWRRTWVYRVFAPPSTAFVVVVGLALFAMMLVGNTIGALIVVRLTR